MLCFVSIRGIFNGAQCKENVMVVKQEKDLTSHQWMNVAEDKYNPWHSASSSKQEK